MELIIRLFILSVLLLICFQDLSSRAVHWFLFPLLVLSFVALRWSQHQLFSEEWQAVLMNTGFLSVQMVVVSGWFSYKQKKWVNVTAELLGWGDILLLLSLAFYLSFLNYLFFYIASLLIILPLWIGWQFILNKKDTQVPLAGLQALGMIFFLTVDWWFSRINITSDDWLIQIMGR